MSSEVKAECWSYSGNAAVDDKAGSDQICCCIVSDPPAACCAAVGAERTRWTGSCLTPGPPAGRAPPLWVKQNHLCSAPAHVPSTPPAALPGTTSTALSPKRLSSLVWRRFSSFMLQNPPFCTVLSSCPSGPAHIFWGPWADFHFGLHITTYQHRILYHSWHTS